MSAEKTNNLRDEARRAEDGEITSVNDSYVFVRFVGDRQSKACRSHDLEFLE